MPVNIYAIAKDRSLIDFGQYVRTLKGEIEFLTLHDPAEFGLRNVEGAIQVAERHIVTDLARQHFAATLGDAVWYGAAPADAPADHYDWTIDCTFCANHDAGVDRYEPCLVVLLEGATDQAVTVMDGPFPSLYPWNEDSGLCSLSSARWTPFSKECSTWQAARAILDSLSRDDIRAQAGAMVESMAGFYRAIHDFKPVDFRLSVRAMPLSGADTRLVDVAKLGDRMLRVRAGKIDAILHAERMIREMIG